MGNPFSLGKLPKRAIFGHFLGKTGRLASFLGKTGRLGSIWTFPDLVRLVSWKNGIFSSFRGKLAFFRLSRPGGLPMASDLGFALSRANPNLTICNLGIRMSTFLNNRGQACEDLEIRLTDDK